MTTPQQKTKALIDKYLSGKATPEEINQLERAYHQAAARMEQPNDESAEEIDRIGMESWVSLMSRIEETPVRAIRLWPRIAAAASIVIAISIGGYFAFRNTAQQTDAVAKIKPGTFKHDALAGNRAILTLANGQQLAVTSMATGRLHNTNIQKTRSGVLIYEPTDVATESYNTLTVPRGGGKHELRLADGSLAVLDAGSSIRFPVAFNSKERRVSVTGQVYFEVVHDAKKPFFVSAKGQIIEDIGTHFNVNAFDDEPGLRTTLLEGSIKIAGKLLKPGQQAIQVNGQFSILNNVNTAEVVAWKNDLFLFTNNTTLPIVMKQISRWYDLEVVYQGSGKPYHFGGDIPRASKLSDVLKILAYSGVQFSVDGKKIIVYQ